MKSSGDATSGSTSELTTESSLELARPEVPSLELQLAHSRAQEALFGEAALVKIGRYRLLEKIGAGGMGMVWSAWDPELGRAVALKLASSGGQDERRRALEEGRALAQLSHPQVVPIYDVLEADERVYLVMEFVRGTTLREVAARKPPAQVLRAYRQAADGLAAAHRAGIVHRDFKPDNAVMGSDGRVRVLDFGLARALAGPLAEIAGTPRYMAPEQRAGEELTAAVDQYALCVALREGLEQAGGVPRWMIPILARGTAAQAAQRYPSMEALSAALARDPLTRWRRRLLAVAFAGIVVAAALGFSFGRARSVEEPCGGGPESLDAAWDAGASTRVSSRLAALGTSYAREALPLLLAGADRHRRQWLDVHRASCVSHRRGELSSAQFDRRTACLSRARAALASWRALAERGTAAHMPGLVQALGELPAATDCVRDDALLAGTPLPPASKAGAVASAEAELAHAETARNAEVLVEARLHAEVGVAVAHLLGHRPLLARAWLARGRVALAGLRDDRGHGDFARASREALAVGDDAVAVEAFARRIWAAGTLGGATEELSSGIELVTALAERLGERGAFVRSLLPLNLGGVALARGDRQEARAHFEQARRRALEVRGPGALELTESLRGLLVVAEREEERVALGRELLARLDELVGPGHPRALRARVQLGLGSSDPVTAEREIEAACARLLALHPTLGASVGECGYELLWMAAVAGQPTRQSLAESVLAARALGAAPHAVAFAQAYSTWGRGATAAAAQLWRTIDEPGHAEWWHRLYAADGMVAAAAALRRAGEAAAAGRALADARATYATIEAAAPRGLWLRRLAAVTELERR